MHQHRLKKKRKEKRNVAAYLAFIVIVLYRKNFENMVLLFYCEQIKRACM
jgi:hypothetical protein